MKKSMFRLMLCISFLVSFCFAGTAKADVTINATNFPDSVFRKYVQDHFDKDKDNKIGRAHV